MTWRNPGAAAPDFGEPTLERPLPEAFSVLERYLKGDVDAEPATLPHAAAGTPFQQRVWEALQTIPRGEVRSYGSIANALGSPRATRAVGSANGKNPVAIAIPCHRVVEAGFRLGGYSAGLERKRFLLQLEGVAISQDPVQPRQLPLIS